MNCLARCPRSIDVQTISLDGTNTIGVVDLKVCIQTVTDCSPELAGQDGDFTIYALDYSEPDTPLVGQGMLSWAIESIRNDTMPVEPKLVTGRVTKNLLGVFGGGSKETLEVRLRLTAAAKVHRLEQQRSTESQQQLHQPTQPSQPAETAMTPTGTAEWNSFIRSNPQIGQPAPMSRVASPALSQHGYPPLLPYPDTMESGQQLGTTKHEIQRIAPTVVDASSLPQAPSSRPSSRTSNRPSRRKSKPPTGRPRGRPRKKPTEGNTSGYEDGTEGEEGPAKKRAKTTQVDKATINTFTVGPDSLRVAASTSGSIRTFRPVAMNPESRNANHLQEVPRAPTPVPDGPKMTGPGRSVGPVKLRRQSTMSQDLTPQLTPAYPDPLPALSPSQEDGRSPESLAPTPAYSEDSPGDIGSSPPVPRTMPFPRSSLPPSSPILPPMPPPQLPHDVSYSTADMNDLFGEEPLPTLEEAVPPQPPARRAIETTDSSGVPIQVFQMQSGPNGQDMVHIRNCNIPRPIPTAPPKADTPPLPPLRQNTLEEARSVQRTETTTIRSPPVQGPTPPPTTDAPEKNASPLPTVEPIQAAVNQEIPSKEPSVVSTQDLAPTNVQAFQEQPMIQPKPSKASNPRPKQSRQLSRSQSAGPLALPSIPASEPAGPSSLSQCTRAEAERPNTAVPSALRRSASTGPLCLPIPASDPVAPISTSTADISLPEPLPPPPPSSPPVVKQNNKNIVKKHAIKQRLEEAIVNGEMPPFCSNCGALETPTWRKIWVKECDGAPETVDFSEKPGRITAIEILRRDEDDNPTLHRVIKKSLATGEDKSAWQELVLCNPCGIWLSKWKAHRPQDRWDKDASRLGQERRRRAGGAGASRSKKARTKSDAPVNPTSEAYLPTDALGPVEPSSPNFVGSASMQSAAHDQSGQQMQRLGSVNEESEVVEQPQSNPGSTHSRGNGTAKSPIDVELDEQLGSTRRVLFPSPKKDSTPKALSEVHVNIMQIESRQQKDLTADKENIAMLDVDDVTIGQDDLDALFRSSTTIRPSTPPPKDKSPVGPFKTPTRSTPNHRPVTRSVSRSIRASRSRTSPISVRQALFQRTPTRTPRSTRRSPRNHQPGVDSVFDTPISRTIIQMLSEPNGFDIGDNDLDLSSLPGLDEHDGSLLDFGNLLSTDAVMPSSPPKGAFGFDYNASASVWAQWDIEHSADLMDEK